MDLIVRYSEKPIDYWDISTFQSDSLKRTSVCLLPGGHSPIFWELSKGKELKKAHFSGCTLFFLFSIKVAS